MSLHWRRTKIIATVGPATDTQKSIKELIKSGVNVFRLNMSHGDHEYHTKIFKRIRNCTRQMDSYTAILMDLCGPKIRVGKFENGSITLKRNAKVMISCAGGIGQEGLIISQYKQLYKDVKKGERSVQDLSDMLLATGSDLDNLLKSSNKFAKEAAEITRARKLFERAEATGAAAPQIVQQEQQP